MSREGLRRTPLFNAGELERAFQTSGAEAIICRSGSSVAHLSGMPFPGTLGRLQDFAHSPRVALLILPRHREPTLVVSTVAAGLARERSWVEDVRVYTEYDESPYALAAIILRECGLADGRIGVERREIGVDRWEEVAGELPAAEFVEVSDLLERMRNLKMPAEVALMKRACDLMDEAFTRTFDGARSGVTERKLHARMIGSMLELGADSGHGMMQCGTNPTGYGGEGDVPVEQGDLLRTDYVCYLDGYAANLSRMAVMGRPTPEQEQTYAFLLDVHRRTIHEKLRPGVRPVEIFRFVEDQYTKGGKRRTGVVGHLAGVWWHQEQPMFTANEQRPLEPQMVVCIEPHFGIWHVQDQVLVRDGDPLLLSSRFDTSTLYAMGR